MNTRRPPWRQIVPALAILGVLAGCGPAPHLALPAGPGEPAGDPAALAATAFGRCGDVRTLTAEINVSGRAGREKIRARLLAGFSAPGAIRLEAVAPFGRPGFILAADQHAATLLLPRDGRVLRGAAPGDVLEALSGIPLSPDDLRLALAGCPPAGATPGAASRYGTAWTTIDFGAAGRAYLRPRNGELALAAFVRPGLIAEYRKRPRWVRHRPSCGCGRIRAAPEGRSARAGRLRVLT